jgi:YD repeat-containing protein
MFTFDANGNETSDGTRTFEWDAENRLVAINQGTIRSEFVYDGLSRRVRIIEKNSGITTDDKRFLWCELEICEERDSTGATVNKRYFPQGFRESSTNYFYATDHLGSIRELTDASATLTSRYDYDPYGRRTQLPGATKNADFGFTAHYNHFRQQPRAGPLPCVRFGSRSLD